MLTIGFALIALSLVLVVTDASKVFLTRRSLVSAADGAALAGVQSLDRDAFYADKGGDALPLDVDAAAAVPCGRTSTTAGLAGDYADFAVVSVQVTAGPRSPSPSERAACCPSAATSDTPTASSSRPRPTRPRRTSTDCSRRA